MSGLLLLSLLSFAGAILSYGGGSLYGDKESFSFTYNMVSNLGAAFNHTGAPQIWPNFFFASGLLFLAAALIIHAVKQGVLTQICGQVTAFLLVLIPFLPSDVFPETHNLTFFLAVCFGGLYALLVSFLNPTPWWLKLFGPILLVYALFLFLVPRPSTSAYWQRVHGPSQKAAMALVYAYLFAATGIKERRD